MVCNGARPIFFDSFNVSRKIITLIDYDEYKKGEYFYGNIQDFKEYVKKSGIFLREW